MACKDVDCGAKGLGGDDELQAMLADPTLQSCCRRDLLDQARGAKLRAALLAADRTDQRAQIRQGVFAAAEQQADSPGSRTEAWEEEEGDEDDLEVQRLRRERVEQLKRQGRDREASRRAGYGRLNDVSWNRLLGLAEELGGCCVCHLAVEGAESCSQLDECLEGLAHRFPRTYFTRSLAPSRGAQSSSLKHTLGLTELPALLCFRGGSVVGRSHLGMFGSEGDILEEEVEMYLKRLSVLKAAHDPGDSGQPQAGPGRPDLSDGDSSEDEADGGAPCEVCGRRYPHEHVRAVYSTREEHGQGEDSEGED